MTTRAEVQKFELFYQENLERIYRFVFSHVRNREASEDLTSQIFLKATRSLDLEQNAHSRRAATHSLEELVEAGWDGPVDANPVRSEAADRVEDILQTLPGQDREVLTCRFLLDLSVRETALNMGVTETNVKVMQYRALRRAATLVDSAAQPKSSFAGLIPMPLPGSR
jgi:RNA polymerase sigma-70 factor (ECF subfamily)